jgi:hypothetical protein
MSHEEEPMKHTASIEDALYRHSFETFKVPPSEFGHAAHLRLAYIYLCEASTEVAAERMKSSLLAFLEHFRIDKSKYHETMTWAWIMAVRHFMEASPRSASSTEFIGFNERLLDSTIMLKHYSAGLLFSHEARASFVSPDVAPIPEH